MEEPVGVACKALWDRAVVLGCVAAGRRRRGGSVFLELGHGHSSGVGHGSQSFCLRPPRGSTGVDRERTARCKRSASSLRRRTHTEAVVDALPFQECFQVGDVGTLPIDQSKQGAAGDEFLLALAVD
jgi:hypothetical protein